MALYYLPVLIRSDRYFIARLDGDAEKDPNPAADFNFVVPADNRVLTPLLTIEDPARIVLNQMAPDTRQDVPLRECHLSMHQLGDGFELRIRRQGSFAVEPFEDAGSGLRLDFQESQKRISVGYYRSRVAMHDFRLRVTYEDTDGQTWSGLFDYCITSAPGCQRVVIDFGSEASQVGYKNGLPQSALVQYDLLENIMSQLNHSGAGRQWRRDDFLNNEPGQPLLFRSFYAIRKNITTEQRRNFPFNFTDDPLEDEVRLFIGRHEVAATEVAFHDNYEIIPNLKLGIERSLQLRVGSNTEDYNFRSHKQELISAVLLRILRLMIRTKPEFQQGGIIVTLLVPNIYTQHEVFELLNELRRCTGALLGSLAIPATQLFIEYETISESDAAFMGYQQTHAADTRLSNGEIALVIDCGKGTTDISMLLADDNENYSSFFRTGFAGAGNVLSYAFAEDFLTLLLRAIPGSNDQSVRDFISQHVVDQNLTVDVLNFLQFIEDQKKRFAQLQVVGLSEFAGLTEPGLHSERTIGTLYKNPAVLLPYADSILGNRSVRWDDEITGLIQKATECIVQCIIASIRDVATRDIRKRIRIVMLSGRAFYFEALRAQLEKELHQLLGADMQIHTVAPGRSINSKNVAIYGAFTGAYKITDFTGIPVDKREGLSRNRDVLNNNLFLYRGIKIEPGNDILYNTAVVKRNNQQLRAFKNKSLDIYFTRDNIYLRLLENQQVKDVRSLYNVLTPAAETYTPIQDLRALSLFPASGGELPSIESIWKDMQHERAQDVMAQRKPKRKSLVQLFQF